MKRDARKFLGIFLVSVLFLSVIIGAIGFVSAAENPLKKGPTGGEWYSDIIISLFGETWEQIISAFMVLLMIIAGVYDILVGFSLFGSKGVQFLLALGLGIIAAMSKLILTISVFLFSLGAGLGAFAVLVGIGAPLIIFIILNVVAVKFVNKMRAAKTASEISAGATEVGAAVGGLGDIAKGFKKARSGAE